MFGISVYLIWSRGIAIANIDQTIEKRNDSLGYKSGCCWFPAYKSPEIDDNVLIFHDIPF